MARDDELSPREITALITQLEQRIDKLKQLYERYFIGVDRKPPMALHHQVVREVLELDQLYIGNTALKFRARTLHQRFTTFTTYWNRTLRQIEEGTYHRDRSRAQRRENQRARQQQQAQEQEQAYELDLEADFMGDLADIDLDEVFEQAVASQSQPQPQQPSFPIADRSEEERERIRLQRLAEIQAQLGLAPAPAAPAAPQQQAPSQPQVQPQSPHSFTQPQPTSSREQKLAAMRERLNRQSAQPAQPQRPATTTQTPSQTTAPAAQQAPQRTPSGVTRAQKLQQLASRIRQERAAPQRTISRSQSPVSGTTPQVPRQTGPHRVVQRRPSSSSGDDAEQRVYRKLLEAKRRCNEPTDNLSFDAVKRSMDRQRESIQRTKGTSNVDFQVVIKDGRAYLKADTKD